MLNRVGLLGIVALVGIGVLVWPVQAAPGLQGPMLPTPTPAPVDDVTYTLTEVGGTAAVQTFTHVTTTGAALGTTEVTTQYPRGMTFTFVPAEGAGPFESVTLRLQAVSELGTRAQAAWDADSGAWVARVWETGEGYPAWTRVAFRWRLRDASGEVFETVPETVDYIDPSRRWFRVETPELTVYWYGFMDDAPDVYAAALARALASTYQRRVDGFGRAMTRPAIGVIYGSEADMREIYPAGAMNRGAAYYNLGMFVVPVRSGPSDWQLEWHTFVAVHELVHLYQYDVLGGLTGPAWWVEGQAQWFATTPGDYDRRLMNLAALQDLPTLAREVPRELRQADGRPDLAYDMGASFINWLIATRGGIETHAAIVARMAAGDTLYEAIEAVTGEPFLAVENAWRAYLGLHPLTPADLDPVLGLEPYADPAIAAGDVITLPPSPPMVQLGASPATRTLIAGACFAGTPVEVLQVGQAADGTVYVELDCLGITGWVTRDVLIPTP